MAFATIAFVELPKTSAAQSPPVDRVTGWRSDIAFWLDQIRNQHYVYKSKPLPPTLIRAADNLSRNVPRYSDDRMLFEMTRLSSYIGDGHTYVLPLGAERFHGSVIPIRFYLFSDGMFVIDGQSGGEKWIGAKLLSIGNTPTAKIIERMKPAISSDNQFGWKWIGPPFLNVKGIIEAVTEQSFNDTIPVALRDRSGAIRHVKFATQPPDRVQGVPKLIPAKLVRSATPLWLRDVGRNFWMEPQPNGSLYVQFNQVANADGYSLKQAGADLDSVVAHSRPSKIMLDVRHNNGGNSYLYPPIIDALTSWEKAVPNGKLYVLTGRNTFSAAQNFISQLDKRTRAIFVGEPSSSKPNFVGEENDLQLPWSGAIASISNRFHENIPGDKRQWIEPDIKIVLSSKDYFANRDPVMDALSRR